MSATHEVAQPRSLATLIGDPGAAGLLLFGMALTWVFVAEVVDHDARGALVYGLIAGGLGQALCGIFSIIRRDNYLGNLLITYSFWLIGFFLLSVDSNLGNANARGWWSLGLIIPSLFLMIPAIRERVIPIILAFVFLIPTLLFLGLSLLNADVGWLPLAVGWSAFASAFPIFFLAYERLISAVEPVHAVSVPEFDEVERRGHSE